MVHTIYHPLPIYMKKYSLYVHYMHCIMIATAVAVGFLLRGSSSLSST